MKQPESDTLLFGLLGVLSLFLLITAAGGGLWNQGGWWGSQWQHQMFQMLCHQNPDRSFWVGGQPMAVCSRCFGIYAGLFAGFLAAPAFPFRYRVGWPAGRIILLSLAALNLADLFGNMLGFWQNTLASRFTLGLPLGMAVLMMLGWDLLKTKRKTKGEDSWNNRNSMLTEKHPVTGRR